MNAARGGRIVTFYSYKGGTGRSMALSNLAWVLAANRKRVLIMDWDLEAPGLHRYFHPFLADKELASARGLMDLLADYADQAIQPPAAGESDDWYRELTDIAPYLLGINFAGFPEGGRIDLLPAGRQGTGYAAKLHAFDWDTFYERLGGGTYLEAVKAKLRETYDFVLIDSRTGVSDTAGICTVQMPDVLVAMFTYNNQSIRGALAVAQSAADTRRRLYGQFSRETFRVFPVPSRADPFEIHKLQLRQAYARKLFTPLLEHLPEREHSAYWAGVEVPYNAYLNYEEVLSPLIFNPEDPKLPLASVLRLASQISDGEVSRYDLPLAPEIKQHLLQAYEQVDDTQPQAEATMAMTATAVESPADVLLRAADSVLGQLHPADLDLARRLLLRLVRLPRGQESPGLKRLLLPVDELPKEEQPLLERFVQAGVLRLTQAAHKGAYLSVELADEVLLARWRQLNSWVEGEKTFLEQRYWIQSAWEQWQRAGEADALLLAAPLAEQAASTAITHASLLTRAEIDFIEASRAYRREELAGKDETQTVLLAPPPQSAPYPVPPVAAAPPPQSAPAQSRHPGWIYAFVAPLGVLLTIALVILLAWKGNGNTISPGVPPNPPQSESSANEAAVGFNIAGNQSLVAGRADEAIGNFDTALKLRPDFAEARFGRARAYELAGQVGKAIADLRAGLALHPDQADAQLQLARLLANSNAKQEAIKEYQQALTLYLSTAQQQEATAALKTLNPAPIRPQVFLHINNQADYTFAASLATTLKAAGTEFMGIQVLAQSTNANVRYANLADERMAGRVRDLVQEILAKAGYRGKVELLYIGSKEQGSTQGRIEVWLPPLAMAMK